MNEQHILVEIDGKLVKRVWTDEDRAKALYETAAKMRGINVPWEECTDSMQRLWRQCVEQLNEIGKGINYDD